jgi:hypothetical protein
VGAFSKYGFRTRRAFAENLTTKCFAMNTDLLDHVQAVRSACEAASSNSCDSFVGRWRITPVHATRAVWLRTASPVFGYSALIWLIWLTCDCCLLNAEANYL